VPPTSHPHINLPPCLERIQQHADYVNELLQEDKFNLTPTNTFCSTGARALSQGPRRAKHFCRSDCVRVFAGKTQPRNFADHSNVFAPAQIRHAEITATLGAATMRWNLRMATNWDSTDVLQAYLKRAGACLRPHSDYFNPSTRRIFPSA